MEDNLIWIFSIFASFTVLFVVKKFLNRNESKRFEKFQTPKECPSTHASTFSLITFWWVDDLIRTGYRKCLTLQDLWPLYPSYRTSTISPTFEKFWNGDVVHTLVATFKKEIFFGFSLELAISLIKFVNPQLIKQLIGLVSSSNNKADFHEGYLIVLFMFLSSTATSFTSVWLYANVCRLRMKMRTALTAAIYRKTLLLSNSARSSITTGEITNLMSTDLNRIGQVIPGIHMIWGLPLVICLCIYFLYLELGVSVFAGVAVLAALIPLNIFASNFEHRFQCKQMEAKDERVKVINEVMAAIRVIKLYGWELPFMERINSIRSAEVDQIRNVAFLNAATSLIWTCAPFLVTLASFTAFVYASPSNVLTPQKAFVSLALFEMLRFPMTEFPKLIAQLVMALVSVKRLNRFLNMPELKKYVKRSGEMENAVEIRNASFSWNGDDSFKLKGINLTVKKGKLVAIVGQVGSGKSSLLSAILGDMEPLSGCVRLEHKAEFNTIAYMSQQAWILNTTLRENILFGSPYERSRYESILEACALLPDIEMLPGGDQTEIGEKGINISGGQKQRVALARACYSNASLLLLDDPLSSVDSHVAQHIFRKVLDNKTGYLRNITRIFVTNNLTFLPEVDQIVLLSGGSITEIGDYQQMVSRSSTFCEFIQKHNNKIEKFLTEKVEIIRVSSKSAPILEKSVSEKTLNSKLIKDEKIDSGQVKLAVYFTYFRSWTWWIFACTVVGFAGTEVISVGSDIWLVVWTNDSVNTGLNNTEVREIDSILRNHRLFGYGLFSVIQTLIFFIGAVSLAKGNINSSITIHLNLLNRIMRSPMRFFDTTPIGRIVSRFSNDIDIIDSQLANNFDSWMTYIFTVVSNIVLICINIPLFTLVAIPIMFLYSYIQKYYISTFRQLTRLESVHKSPIFSHFSESLTGVSTIRAFGALERFSRISSERMDTFQRCFRLRWCTNRWLALRLDFCGNLIVLFAALFVVLTSGSINPGFAGLILTYALRLTETLNYLMRTASEMERNMVPVERIEQYIQNKTESQWTRKVNANPKIPLNWPNKGEIEFSRYSMRYREGLDLVLDSIDFKIQGGEKIGIVGRTGAGKSSLALGLFRIVERASGFISIDRVRIDKIGLHELRQQLAIIPQDPILFSGTIRSNIDPFNHYTDKVLWQALEHSHLAQYITSQESGLDSEITENGSNLSLGQRQLLCLTRALLLNAKILVLDEATAAIDLQTDALIQRTIREQFAHCTVLTIAHRIETILDSDRVLVLEQGRVVEFDEPEKLLADCESKFYSLAKNANIL